MQIVPIAAVSASALLEVYNKVSGQSLKSFRSRPQANARVGAIMQEKYPGLQAGYMPVDEVPAGSFKAADVREFDREKAVLELKPRSTNRRSKKVEKPTTRVEAPKPAPVAVVPRERPQNLTHALGVSAAWILYNSDRSHNAAT
jgi:hypothetical protein